MYFVMSVQLHRVTMRPSNYLSIHITAAAHSDLRKHILSQSMSQKGSNNG